MRITLTNACVRVNDRSFNGGDFDVPDAVAFKIARGVLESALRTRTTPPHLRGAAELVRAWLESLK